MEIAIIGDRGQITIPNVYRKKFKLNPKQPVLIDEVDGRIVIIPAVVLPKDEIKKIAKDFSNKEINQFLEENELSDDEYTNLKKLVDNV